MLRRVTCQLPSGSSKRALRESVCQQARTRRWLATETPIPSDKDLNAGDGEEDAELGLSKETLERWSNMTDSVRMLRRALLSIGEAKI
jgi:hypothetical protein